MFAAVFMLMASASNKKTLRRIEALQTVNQYDRAAVSLFLDAGIMEFHDYFDDVDAAAEDYGGYQELWNAVIPALLQDGCNAELKHVKPDLLGRLGTNYIEELDLDPWGNPYQFYAPPPGKDEKPVYVWSMGPDGVSSWRPEDAMVPDVPDLGGDDVYWL